MELELKRTAETGDINAFYGVVERKPGILKAIEAKDFVETPLHVAASAGNTELAIEILSLKPSFGRKLNPSGYSPLDMALRYGQQETVKQLIKFDPELIGLGSRERKTPLHYAAETDDADLVAEFLVACPTAVKQLTVRGETAVHLAVLKGSTNAFDVLMGWIIRTDNKEILGWKDNKGNTVLHIAAQTGQVEVTERLIKEKVNLHGKNQANQTALDMVSSAEMQKLLRRAGGLWSSELRGDLMYKDILSTNKYKEWRQAARRLVYLDKEIADGTRNAFLVATVLIVTATFQVVLSPPVGGWPSAMDMDSNPTLPAAHPTATSQEESMIELPLYTTFYIFTLLNSITFAFSLVLTYILMPFRRYYSLLLRCSLFFLMLTYLCCVFISAPLGAHLISLAEVVIAGFIIFLVLLTQRSSIPPVVLIIRRWLLFHFSKKDFILDSQVYEMEMQVRLGKYQNK